MLSIIHNSTKYHSFLLQTNNNAKGSTQPLNPSVEQKKKSQV